jgi:hypothetical protein
MLRHVRTTVRLDDGLLKQARALARQRHLTVSALIEEGLRLMQTRVVLPVSRETGGVLPGVDLDNSVGLLDLMEARR